MNMQRSSSSLAIVLRKSRVGEIHKSLTLLTPSLGLIQAMAHGALKIASRLRPASEPFHLLKVYLYHEPVKDQYKITDVESIEPMASLRRSVAKYFTASLWAEVCLRSYGGGEETDTLFLLLREALQLLDRAPAGRELTLSLQFILRFLGLAGHSIDPAVCGRCQLPTDPQSLLFLAREEGLLVCPACAEPGALALPPGAQRYLLRTRDLPLPQAAAVGLEKGALAALRETLYHLVQASLETPLNTLRCGAGIL
jgi:DNA repair protein RecO (recombination protein O)